MDDRPDPRRLGRTTLHLTDGRVFDLTGFTIDEVYALMTLERVTPADIRETRHVLSAEETGRIPSIVCPRCWKKSWNRNDIAERYCGACHQFHDEEGYA